MLPDYKPTNEFGKLGKLNFEVLRSMSTSQYKSWRSLFVDKAETFSLHKSRTKPILKINQWIYQKKTKREVLSINKNKQANSYFEATNMGTKATLLTGITP